MGEAMRGAATAIVSFGSGFDSPPFNAKVGYAYITMRYFANSWLNDGNAKHRILSFICNFIGK